MVLGEEGDLEAEGVALGPEVGGVLVRRGVHHLRQRLRLRLPGRGAGLRVRGSGFRDLKP